MARGPNSPLVSFVLTQLGVTTADLIFLMTSVLLQPVGLFLPPPRGFSVRKTGTLRHFRQAGSSTGNGYRSVCRAGGAQGGDLLSKDLEPGKLLLSEVWKANQGLESSPEPHAGSVSGGPVLLSSLWWGPEPAATSSSSVCLALSQSGGGRGFALPPAF